MGSFVLFPNNGLLVTQEKLRVHDRNLELSRSRNLTWCNSSCTSSPLLYLGLHNCSNNRHRLLWNSRIRSVTDENFESKETHLGKRKYAGKRKIFSLRLKPRLRLLSMRLRRVSIWAILDNLAMFLRKNIKKVTISTSVTFVLGICFLFLKLTSMPSPKVVPYSDLVMSIQNGVVSRVLFEEGSRRIYYNTNSLNIEKSQDMEDKSSVSNAHDESVVDTASESIDVRSLDESSASNVQHENVVDKASVSIVVRSLDESSVSNVQYENVIDTASESIVVRSLDESSVNNVQHENMVDTATESNAVSKTSQKVNDVFRKSRKSQASTPQWQFSTRKIDHDESYLLSLMREKGTIYSSAPQSVLVSMRSIIITILSLWIPLTPLMWILYRQLSAANSPAKKQRPSTQVVNFDDVEGVDSAKVELMEVVSCLQGAINYNKLGAKLPRGVLLVGPPGTGKTLLARAVAGEAGVPFFSVSASEFVELFVGRGAARIRDLFSVARKNSPSIIFIDELDAVGGKRGRSFNDERDQTLNQLLTEMDGFDSDIKVVVIAATNRPEALDSALCRPGRFSRKVYVGEPDEDGRRRILAVHLRGVPLDEDSDLICSLVASLTPGFVGADLANIINEAALLAARRGGDCVSREDIMEAIERAKFGINNREAQPSISKELVKLFPWMPSLMGGNNTRQDGSQGPLGYQTLS